MDSQFNPLRFDSHRAESAESGAAPDSQDVAARYLSLAVQGETLAPPGLRASDILLAIPSGSPFAPSLQALAALLSPDGLLNQAEARVLRQLVGLVTRPEVSSCEAEIHGLLSLAHDFVGPQGQPTGLSPVHAEALSRLVHLIQGRNATALDVMIAIYDVRRFAQEGAAPLLGAYSGLTEVDINAVPGLPGPAPDPCLASGPPLEVPMPQLPQPGPPDGSIGETNQPEARQWLDSLLESTSPTRT